MATGYWNKVLHADLTRRTTWVEEPGEDVYRKLLGGRGFIARYLLEYVPEGADPLGPRLPIDGTTGSREPSSADERNDRRHQQAATERQSLQHRLCSLHGPP